MPDQDRTLVYHDTGQWFWLTINRIDRSLFTENTEYIILDETEVQDIDTLSDWQIAELNYQLINKY
ncbi:CMP-N-acetylneuraminic acid synthetase [Mucilaginibacter sp. UYCu711]